MWSLGWQEILILLMVVPILWGLVDCLQRQFKDPTTKILWVLIIVLGHILGLLIYLAVGRATGTKGGQTAADRRQGPGAT